MFTNAMDATRSVANVANIQFQQPMPIGNWQQWQLATLPQWQHFPIATMPLRETNGIDPT
jgi:hypothetical protein